MKNPRDLGTRLRAGLHERLNAARGADQNGRGGQSKSKAVSDAVELWLELPPQVRRAMFGFESDSDRTEYIQALAAGITARHAEAQAKFVVGGAEADLARRRKKRRRSA